MISPYDDIHIAVRRALSRQDGIDIRFSGRDSRELGPRRLIVDLYIIDADAAIDRNEVTDRIPADAPILWISEDPGASTILPDDIDECIASAVKLAAAGYSIIRGEAISGSGTTDDGSLTLRELDVLDLLAGGASNKEAAEELGISENTVKYHLSELYGKLGVNSRSAAVVEAVRRGILDI